MKTAALTLIFFTIAIANVRAQQPAATSLGGERLDESWPDFVQHTQMPVPDCATAEERFMRSGTDTHLSGDVLLSLLHDAATCKQIELLKQGKEASFTLRNANGRDYLYKFENQKLAQVSALVGNFADALAAATKQFGAPAKAYTETTQNGYGATFHVRRAKWSMSDGAEIFLSEGISDKDTSVTAFSADRLKKIGTPKDIPPL